MSRVVPGRCGHTGRIGRGRGARVLALALWLAAGSAAVAAELPRVFFTPGERAAIRAERLAGRPMAQANEPAAASPTPTTAGGATAAAAGAPPPAARHLRVDGVTLGRGAAKSVWISGERVADGGRWRGYRVQVTSDGARLVAADGSVRHLRVGVEVPQ